MVDIFLFDTSSSEIVLRDTTIPTPPPIGGVEYWNGVSWIATSVQYWNGTIYAPSFAQYYNGSIWVTV